AEVVNHVVFADPGNQAARELQAATLEQLGYQAESGPWRNFYLTGAAELRGTAAPVGGARAAGQAGVVAAMTVEMVFDLLGVRVDGPRADGAELALGWRCPDLGEEWTVRLEHGALSARPVLADDVAVTLTMDRPVLTRMLLDRDSIPDAV